MATLLATKLFIPPLHSETVYRSALVARINDSLERKITLISAPAGFGKTTLLSDWIRTCNYPVSWVSLDRDDNDVNRFWSYFITSINRVHEDIGISLLANLQSQLPPSSNEILTGLINEITSSTSKPITIVLDDYHLIDTPEIHEGVSFLVEYCPPSLHLVIATRVDPQFPLSRWRVQGKMNELRTADLQFTVSETRDLLNGVLGLELRWEDIEALERRTEGWIAGLQMAAISIKGLLQNQDANHLPKFIEAFTGSHRFVLDYLFEEVINQQNEEIKEFLLKTSILDSITAPLCQAVTGNENSRAIIEYLDRANLFLVPLDDTRCWYRYHHLFADLLRNQLEHWHPEQVPLLHSEASEWYEKNGWVADALQHALLMEDLDRIISLVEGNATTMIYHGELKSLSRWLDQLPENLIRTRPWLCVSQAWAMIFSGRPGKIEPLLQNVEETFLSTSKESYLFGDELDHRRLAGHVAAIRGHVATFDGDYKQAKTLLMKALEHLPGKDMMARSLAVGIMITTLRWLGDLKAASQIANEALENSLAANDKSIQVNILFSLAKIKHLAGQLRDVYAICQEALKIANAAAGEGSRLFFNTGYIYGCMSSVMLEWNNLDLALRYARESIRIGRQWGQVDALADGYLQIAKIFQAISNQEEAIDAMQKAEKIAQGYSQQIGAYMSANSTRLSLRRGDRLSGSEWAAQNGLGAHDKIEVYRVFLYIVFARVLVAQGDLDDALNLLVRLEDLIEKTGNLSFMYEILVLQALAWQAKGDDDKALNRMEQILSRAKPEGYVRIIIDEGIPMGRLLNQAIAHGIQVEYASSLLAALKNDRMNTDRGGELSEAQRSSAGLSEREMEVLSLLATPLSHAKMAEELYISLNTVRSHVKRIYQKFNAHNRIQAIQRARELNIL